MPNPIYETVQKNQEQNITQQFTDFANNFTQKFNGMRPEQIGPQLVQNGTIPQNQFEKFRQIANMITGMNK